MSEGVGKFAPLLGAALGGPVGAAAGTLAAAALGVRDSPVDVAAAVKSDPGAAIKLRELEMKHAESLQAMANKVDIARIDDTKDARKMHREHWMPWVMTCILSGMVLLMGVALVFVDIPAGNADVLYLIAGQVIGAFATAVAYWLGSSRGSAMKESQIAALTQRK